MLKLKENFFWKERISRKEFFKKIFKFCLGLSITPFLVSCKKMFIANSSEQDEILTFTEALYYLKLSNNKIRCLLCPRKCVLKEGQRGFCNARINEKGKCYSLVYGKAILNTLPIYERALIYCTTEDNVLRLATAGCNMKCKFCLAWSISQAKPEEIKTPLLTPQDVIYQARNNNCNIIAYTNNEPTVYYEYLLDVAKFAKSKGLINIFSTNGYINEEPLKKLLKYMDAVSFGLKGFTDYIYREYCSAELKPVLKTLKILRDEGIGFEIVYPVISSVNDDLEQIRDMCIWIKENLGKKVPLHFYRYLPSYRLAYLPPTPVSTLETMKQLANEIGLKYVYIYLLGLYPDPELEERIYCPNCNKLILYRKGMKDLLVNNTVNGRCKFCGERLFSPIFD